MFYRECGHVAIGPAIHIDNYYYMLYFKNRRDKQWPKLRYTAVRLVKRIGLARRSGTEARRAKRIYAARSAVTTKPAWNIRPVKREAALSQSSFALLLHRHTNYSAEREY